LPARFVPARTPRFRDAAVLALRGGPLAVRRRIGHPLGGRAANGSAGDRATHHLPLAGAAHGHEPDDGCARAVFAP
jgi:hypothetical protein